MSGYTWRDPSRWNTGVDLTPEPPTSLERRAHNWGGICHRGCCWTPFEVCALARTCGCHFEIADLPGLDAEEPLSLAAEPDPDLFMTETTGWTITDLTEEPTE